MLNARFVTLVGMTLAAAGTRLLPHPPNLTPIAAMALFGGFALAQRYFPALDERGSAALGSA